MESFYQLWVDKTANLTGGFSRTLDNLLTAVFDCRWDK
ncbi:MAG: hypothetical protein OFPII_35240 [Osedax symbiont Rs1]|nr:MAG: hypothetical protein OFPII_35240 [Osedax symbiont Rs1]